jgi:hypothetical protein
MGLFGLSFGDRQRHQHGTKVDEKAAALLEFIAFLLYNIIIYLDIDIPFHNLVLTMVTGLCSAGRKQVINHFFVTNSAKRN